MNQRTDHHATATSPNQGDSSSPWWKTASNPACPDWCTDDHPADEFAAGGMIRHQAVIGQGGGVVLTRVAIVSEAGAPGTTATVYDEVEVTTDRKGVQLTSDGGFGVPLDQAVSLAREVLRLADDRGHR